MIKDAFNTYSTLQAVTATADSTNTIDQLKAGDAYSSMWLRIKTDTAFAGGTSLAVNLLTADDTAFSTNLTTIPILAATAVASLTADTLLAEIRIPLGMRRYHKLNYVVVGTMTAGTINSELVTDVPTNRRGTKFGYLE